MYLVFTRVKDFAARTRLLRARDDFPRIAVVWVGAMSAGVAVLSIE